MDQILTLSAPNTIGLAGGEAVATSAILRYFASGDNIEN
jgi:hypothetical protein